MLGSNLRVVQSVAGPLRTRCANQCRAGSVGVVLEGWTTVPVTQCGNLGGTVKSPLAQFEDELLSPHWGFLQGTNPAKQTSSCSLIRWQRATEQVAVVFSLGLRGRARVLAVLGNNDLLQEHLIQKQHQSPDASLDQSVYVSLLVVD